MARPAKILILIQEGIINKKISYERRDYESVDEKLGYVPKNYVKKNSCSKGLRNIYLWR